MLKATVKYLAQETSIHGFKFLANKKVNKFLRLFWFFSLLLSISVLLWYAKGLYVKLNFEPEINVRVKFKSMSEIPFPAVTICDSVFAKNNSINFIQYFNNKRPNSQKNMTVEGKHIMAANIHVCAPHLSFFNQDFDDKRSDFDIVKVLNDSSLRTDEIFLLCSYKKTLAADCNNIFNKVLTDNGFCHSANMQGYNTIFNKNVLSKDFDSYKRKNISSSWLHKTRQVNDDNETIYWTLDSGYIDDSDDSNVIPKRANKQNFFNNYLFINHIDEENYCPQLGKIFKIFFHLPNEIPTIFSREYSIEIGHQKLMFLNAKLYTSDESLKGYTPKQRQCYFEGEKNLKFFKSYTKSHCDWECVTNYTLDICGCTKFSMPRDNNTPVCDMQKKKCYYNAMLTWPNNRSFYENNDNPCDCYETCNDIKYEINYEDDSDFHNFYSLSLLKNAQDGKLTYLRLQFKSHMLEVYEKYASYKLQNFIADFGGLLGLFLGCSLISIAEIVFLLVHLFSDTKKFKNSDEIQAINQQKNEGIQLSKGKDFIYNFNKILCCSRVFSSNNDYHLNQPNYLLSKQDFLQMNKNMKRLEQKIDDLQIQYNVEILSTLLQYKKASK